MHCIDMNTAHTHSIDACRNKFSRLGSFGKGKGGHKGKGKGKDGKGRGKGFKGMPKGKGLRKGFKGGSTASKGSAVLQLPAQAHGSSSAPISPATFAIRRVITSHSALNGLRFVHPQRINKHGNRHRAWA